MHLITSMNARTQLDLVVYFSSTLHTHFPNLSQVKVQTVYTYANVLITAHGKLYTNNLSNLSNKLDILDILTLTILKSS